MSCEEAHQAGLEKGRRQDLEQKIQAGYSARLLKEMDEDRQNKFMRKQGEESKWVWYSDPTDPSTWEWRVMANGERRRVRSVVFTVEMGEEGMRKTRCGRVVKASAKASAKASM